MGLSLATGLGNGSDGKPAMRSPGRPSMAVREDRQRFWQAIARGGTSEDAAVEAPRVASRRDAVVP